MRNKSEPEKSQSAGVNEENMNMGSKPSKQNGLAENPVVPTIETLNASIRSIQPTEAIKNYQTYLSKATALLPRTPLASHFRLDRSLESLHTALLSSTPDTDTQTATVSSRFVNNKPSAPSHPSAAGNRYTRLMKKTAADPTLAELWPAFEFGRPFLGKRLNMHLEHTQVVDYAERAVVCVRHARVQKVPLGLLPWVGKYVWEVAAADRLNPSAARVLKVLLQNFLILVTHASVPMSDCQARIRKTREKRKSAKSQVENDGRRITLEFLEDLQIHDTILNSEEAEVEIQTPDLTRLFKPLLDFEQYLRKSKTQEYLPGSILEFISPESVTPYLFCKKLTLLNNLLLVSESYLVSHLKSADSPKSKQFSPVIKLSEEEYIQINRQLLRLEDNLTLNTPDASQTPEQLADFYREQYESPLADRENPTLGALTWFADQPLTRQPAQSEKDIDSAVNEYLTKYYNRPDTKQLRAYKYYGEKEFKWTKDLLLKFVESFGRHRKRQINNDRIAQEMGVSAQQVKQLKNKYLKEAKRRAEQQGVPLETLYESDREAKDLAVMFPWV